MARQQARSVDDNRGTACENEKKELFPTGYVVFLALKYIPNREKKSHIWLEMCYNLIWIFVTMNMLTKRSWNGNIIQKII